MTTKERLHRLVDALPEPEAIAAARYLEYLAASADPVAAACALAPDDDEPMSDEERAALSDRAKVSPGDYISIDELRRAVG